MRGTYSKVIENREYFAIRETAECVICIEECNYGLYLAICEELYTGGQDGLLVWCMDICMISQCMGGLLYNALMYGLMYDGLLIWCVCV